MKRIYAILLALTVFGTMNVGAQNLALTEKLAVLADPAKSSNNWIRFKQELSLPVNSLFRDYRSAFDFGANDELVMFRTTERAGKTHHRLQQYYKGIAVEGGEVIVHARGGFAEKLNGKFTGNLNLDVNPRISERSARQIAFQSTGAEEISPEANAKEGVLLITLKNSSLPKSAENYRLAYKFMIETLRPHSEQVIYVDAQTGEVLKARTMKNSCSTGSVNTRYNGTKSIQTTYRSWTSDYKLYNDCLTGGGIVHTEDQGSGEVIDGDNVWNNTTDRRTSATAHWVGEQAYKYYYNTFGRKSYDDANGTIHLIAHDNRSSNSDGDNAYWSQTWHNIYIGDGNTFFTSPLVSLDVLGHEFTHGVVEYTAGLDYEAESGALNESFADIFGTMVENYTLGSSSNYIMAEDCISGGIRSMSNPGSLGQPDTYQGGNWVSTSDVSKANDYGGVHTNSGVQNLFYYLLAEGGSGTNDDGDAYSVTGIGKSSASQIGYSALCDYLTSTSDYQDARNAWLEAAEDLYGSCSAESEAVGLAWYAVGVARRADDWTNYACGDYNTTTTVRKKAIHNLYAGDLCSSPTYTKVHSGTTMYFVSGYQIIWENGFTAEEGSEVSAYISDCGYTAYSKQGDKAENSQSESQVSGFSEQYSTAISNYPNPFSESTAIHYVVKEANSVNIVVLNILGQKVADLVESGTHAVGEFTVHFQAAHLPAGTYFCRMEIGERTEIHPLMVIR